MLREEGVGAMYRGVAPNTARVSAIVFRVKMHDRRRLLVGGHVEFGKGRRSLMTSGTFDECRSIRRVSVVT